MFVGHYSAALVAAAHPKAPRLGTLFVAAQLMDLGFFTFVLTGTEHMRLTPGFTVMNNMDLYDMPLTHSLLGAGGLALMFGIAVALWLRSAMAGAIAGTVVVSHWVLDLLVHVPDLTLAGSPPKLGLGLWNCPAIEMPLEIGLLFASAWLFARAKRPQKWRLAVLLAVLLAFQAFNWFAPQPTELDASQSILGLVAYLIAAAVAWWVAKDRSDVQVA
ncbi:MAG: hypothetical protein IPO50_07740 [Sphingomonadales bacterium]|nr:hypothetical protein [Sphingomonadales bacterium]